MKILKKQWIIELLLSALMLTTTLSHAQLHFPQPKQQLPTTTQDTKLTANFHFTNKPAPTRSRSPSSRALAAVQRQPWISAPTHQANPAPYKQSWTSATSQAGSTRRSWLRLTTRKRSAWCSRPMSRRLPE